MSEIDSSTASTKTFETALWINAAVFGIELLVFTLLRKRFKSIYEPRTFIPKENKRSKPLSSHLFGWPLDILRADYHDIRRTNGMDAFFFVRFLRMMVKILLPIWILSWIVLLPLTAINQSSGQTGLDRFTFGNIDTNSQPRYAAHIILAYIFTIWIWYNIKNEMSNFVTTRQQYFVDPTFSSTAQANTVLITGIPARFLSERALAGVFAHVPGGVKKVWINRDLGELPKLYDRRVNALGRLESAETKLLKLATKAHTKKFKASEKGSASEAGHVESADALIPQDKRPSHKIPKGKVPLSLLFFGKKVDTIEWAREEVAFTTAELEKGREVLREEEMLSRDHTAQGKIGGVLGLVNRGQKVVSPKKGQNASPSQANADEDLASNTGSPTVPNSSLSYPPLSSAFVLFHNQAAAHMAAQLLLHHEPYAMAQSDREIGVAPEDVLWGNLGLNPYERKLRMLVSYAATAALIIFWAIPVAFVGAVSNVASLCATYSWLAWICKLPATVIGIIEGILPPVLLAVLMMLLPIVLRLLAKFEGIPRRTGLELSLMTRYFLFQIIHSFLIVTLASGIIAALPQLVGNPTSIPTILAKNLPSASNFFLTYVVLQGLSGAAAGFLQAIPLVIYYVKLFLLGSTPRSVYGIRYNLRGVSWGTLFPATTLIAVIAITYSVISPIINGLACFTFFLFYMLYKYLFLYAFDQPASQDTGGLFFPKAIQHVFVGLYIQQICLAALFFLARNASGKASAIPEGALMIVLIICTAMFHMVTNNSYGPLLHYLPLSIADKAHGVAGHAEYDVDGMREGSDVSDSSLRRAVPSAGNKRSLDTEKSEHAGLVRSGAGVHNHNHNHTHTHGNEKESGNGVGDVSDFNHPATVESQRVVWIPADTLGLSAIEERGCAQKGVEASTLGASMNAKGRVTVEGPPPGEVL